jgi:hypothetical protein
MDQMYGLAAWLVRFKGISFEKGNYGVCCVSLANGGNKAYPEASYELQIFPVREGTGPDHPHWRMAGEPEMIVQFHGLNDVAASAIPHVVVNSVVKGGLPPTKAKRPEWFVLLSGLFKKLGASQPRFV